LKKKPYFPTDNIGALFLEGDQLRNVKVRTSVDINATPEQVFTLITDLPKKTKLCPHTAIIRIVQLPAGPVEVGTIFYHRVVVNGQIVDYHNNVTEFENNKRMVTQSDTQPSFRIEVTVEAINEGCRLSQEESFSLSELLVPIPKGIGWLGKILKFFFGDKEVLRQGENSLAREAEETRADLQNRLEGWLNGIRKHLNKQTKKLKA
jgi:hypothetical protein